MNKERPLIVESNRKVILETQHPEFEQIRNQISVFLNLVKSPQKFYTYEISRISLWNGFSGGMTETEIVEILTKYSKFKISNTIIKYISNTFDKFGVFELTDYSDEKIELIVNKKSETNTVLSQPNISKLFEFDKKQKKYFVKKEYKGILKSLLTQANYPVKDFCQYEDGDPIDINLSNSFQPRKYQTAALASFLGDTSLSLGGSGVLVMPCGSGKTIVGLLAINHLKMSTLIITPNIISLRQWRNEIIKNSSLDEDDIGEYSGQIKDIKKITLTTYQILTYRKDKKGEFQHLSLFHNRNWGLIVYDEIHMLPANMFRYVTAIQSKRRLGLTATLVREDGKESDVFSLIGPKKYDLPWKELEEQKHIAEVKCFEIKVMMDRYTENEYFTTPSEIKQYRIAAENPEKLKIIKNILNKFPNHQTIIIGQYISQLENIAETLNTAILTGKTPNDEREKIYKEFNQGKLNTLVVSKIANFAVDLPNAEIAIQISGSFGSRQEEAQRLGRIIRPKPIDPSKNKYNQAMFFTLATQYTKEEIFAQNRKIFLVAQGYNYEIIHPNMIENVLTNIQENDKDKIKNHESSPEAPKSNEIIIN